MIYWYTAQYTFWINLVQKWAEKTVSENILEQRPHEFPSKHGEIYRTAAKLQKSVSVMRYDAYVKGFFLKIYFTLSRKWIIIIFHDITFLPNFYG